ncbi:Zona pellucida sperm-binding protein 3 [Triplophysa tibetana]|uniref:Zona pellucida sperm-binding protein 3 n=1 Tax=Triplophysa tibetana TaxID=1572043 RepID=A0A5A9NGT1_9TELE|nr:Zona pellucida sperm-binding protein 3 [Triplophysa tibetana]
MTMGLVDLNFVGYLLLIAVELSAEQWSGFQQGQDPMRLQQQQQQPSSLSPQQALQSRQGADPFHISRTEMSPMVDTRRLQEGNTQSKQLMQGPAAPLTWQYPLQPEEPLQPEVPFELQIPRPSVSVAARCGENLMQVEVKKDFYGNGQLVNPAFLSLGGCGAVGEDVKAQVIIFESELQACGSSLTMTADELVYTFTLRYTPEAPLQPEVPFELRTPSPTVSVAARCEENFVQVEVKKDFYGTPIVRAESADVAIECHYPRLHNVSSNALIPAWVPFAATRVEEEVLVFSLKLMTDDWMFERPANQYFLGQFMNFEASVKQYNHVPFRVFIDDCVATAAPDVNSVPRYSFIENYGCMVDAKLTGSPSRFMRRVQNDKLQFQLEAFRFQQTGSGSVYFTCALKAVIASTTTNPERKACSLADGWTSADENDQVCMCCDATCGSSRKGRSLSDSGLVSEGEVTIGPIVISE